jgi:hypothetical protein
LWGRKERRDMDPNACMDRIEEAVKEGNWEECEEAFQDLREWHGKGGFFTEAMHRRRIHLEMQSAMTFARTPKTR